MNRVIDPVTIHTAARACLLALLVIGAFGASGVGGSLATFSETHAGNGSFTAANDFGLVPPGEMDQAFNDANGNGYYDEGEESTYGTENLTDFDDPDANLVIPSAVGEVSNMNTQLSITAGSIRAGTDFWSNTRQITLTATDGDVDIAGMSLTVDGGNQGIYISASGDVNASGAILSTQTGDISIDTDGDLNFDDGTASINGGNGAISLTGVTVSDQNATYNEANGGWTITETGGGE